MAFAGYFSQYGLVSSLWLVVAYFIMTVAELCLSPIGLSLVSKLAPKKFLSLTMGCWFLTSFLGNLIAGVWGGKYEVLSPMMLFGILAIFSLLVALLLTLFIKKLNISIEKNNI